MPPAACSANLCSGEEKALYEDPAESNIIGKVKFWFLATPSSLIQGPLCQNCVLW